MAPIPQSTRQISVPQPPSCPENRSPDTQQIPTIWTSRPYLQSQSFSRSYGSILPTSLTHIVLSTRGCSPWRPAAVMSTAQPKRRLVRYRSLRFSRDNGYAPDVSKGETLCRLSGPISDQFDSRVISFERVCKLLRRKENSSRGIH